MDLSEAASLTVFWLCYKTLQNYKIEFLLFGTKARPLSRTGKKIINEINQQLKIITSHVQTTFSYSEMVFNNPISLDSLRFLQTLISSIVVLLKEIASFLLVSLNTLHFNDFQLHSISQCYLVCSMQMSGF